MTQALPLIRAILLLLLLTSCERPLPMLGTLPDFHLFDQRGRPIQREEIDSRVWVANFVFTRCLDICPTLSRQMATVQHSLQERGADSVRLLSFSVDPDYDTPERLLSYSRAFGADPERWFFLTGDIGEVQRTVVGGLKMSMTPSLDGGSQILHGEQFVLGDKQGRIRGYFSVHDLDLLIHAAIKLTKEK